MFDEVSQVTAALGKQNYISTDDISTVMFLASKLDKPLLTEGPAGVGKTELAKAWAKATDKRLIRLQCYEGLDESKALYEWEYAKQMLYTQLLRDKLSELLSTASSLSDAADRLAARGRRLLLRTFSAGTAPAASHHRRGTGGAADR